MTAWPRWNRNLVDGLVNYVLPLESARLGQFPGKSDRDPVARLRQIYDTLCAFGIEYEHEPVGGDATTQPIRTPFEVLSGPQRSATCVDLSVLGAALCLHAGLHPYILITPGHALLAVYVGDGDPASEVNWDVRPNPAYQLSTAADCEAIRELGVRSSLKGAGQIVAVEMTCCATDGDREPRRFSEAVKQGALHLADKTVKVCDVGIMWRSEDQLNPGVAWDVSAALFPNRLFDEPSIGETPTRLTRSQYRVVPFQPTVPYVVMVDRARSATTDSGPTLLVVHGRGGSGKSRLIAEVADTLGAEGWTTGVVRRGELEHVDPERLAAVAGPLLVAVDYADAVDSERIRALIRALQGRTRCPAVVVLAARSAGQWWTDIESDLGDKSLKTSRYLLDPLDDIATDRPERVWTAAINAFAMRKHRSSSNDDPDANASDGDSKNEPVPRSTGRAWTSLDLVLMAWLRINYPGFEVTNRHDLYNEVLRHEYEYWKAERQSAEAVDQPTFRRYAAHLTAASPSTQHSARAVIADIDDASLIAFSKIWAGGWHPDGAADPLSLEPDSVGDFLIRLYFGQHPDEFAVLARNVEALDELGGASSGRGSAWLTFARNLTRAEVDDPEDAETIARLWTAAITKNRELWRPLLIGASLGSHSMATALSHLVEAADMNGPDAAAIRGISAGVPLGHGTLRALGLSAAERLNEVDLSSSDDQRANALLTLGVRLAEAGRRLEALAPTAEAASLYRELAASARSTDEANNRLADLAMSLNNLGIRLSDAGRRSEALESTMGAVASYRALAETAPDAYLPDLAGSLNNLGIRLSEAGRRSEALESTMEAVASYRALAETAPDAYLPDLAGSLNNLGIRLSEAGRRSEALEPTMEAVASYRALAETAPDAYLPDLAGSLNNLGIRLSEAGRRSEALEPTMEAVASYRALAETAPDAYLPDLAMSLNNLGIRLSDAGRRSEALEPTMEAVASYRALAETAPDAYLPDLAGSLNNLGIRLSEAGRRSEALEPTMEAVASYRALAETAPDAYLPDLAMSLNNLGAMLSDAGRRSEALEPTMEAVASYRALAETAPDAYLPDLAMSLNNLGIRLSDAGRRSEALEPTMEAVASYRALAETAPDAYLPDLAMSLNNLGAMLSEAGRRSEALEPTMEAVASYRALAETAPDAYLPDLAMSLNNLGIRLSKAGRRSEALEPTMEAVAIRRALAETAPDAYLPDLAMSLNNLGIMLSEAGRRSEALESTMEAVASYRALAETAPDAYLPDLAGSLNNLGIRLSEAGRRSEALEPTMEAVAIRRALAETAPDAYLPDLAGSLNNLGAMLSEAGRRSEALESTMEAVAIRRALAETAPDAYLPDLAMSLNNLGVRLSEAGRRSEALEPTMEAVAIRRALAETAPDAYLPDLAGSLNNLGIRLSEAGRRSEALESTMEAVAIRRALAETAPDAYLPDLAMSLNNLGVRLSEAGRRSEASALWRTVAGGLPDPAARAWLHALCQSEDAEPLESSIATLDAARDSPLLGPARRAVRQVALQEEESEAAQPAWAWAPVADDDIAALNEWLAKPDWLSRRGWISANFTGPGEGSTLAQAASVFADLYPGEPTLAELASLLTAVESGEVDVDDWTSEGDAEWHLRSVVDEWFGTRTWAESASAFATNRDTLMTSNARLLLQQTASDSGRTLEAMVHLALIELVEDGRLDADVFEWAQNATSAYESALTALRAGDTRTALLLAGLNPQASSQHPHGWLLLWLSLTFEPATREHLTASGSSPAIALQNHLTDLARDTRYAARIELDTFARNTAQLTETQLADIDDLRGLLQ